jgi:polo-like kinase 1
VKGKTGLPLSGGGFGNKTPQADIWINKWVDYSSKYGLGYLLINGATGVYFNDSTKIILSPC